MSLPEFVPIAAVHGAYLLKREVFEDDRGYFSETQRREWDTEEFVQVNTSFSWGNVLRGLHFQTKNPQGKLITCLYGSILDVIFDLRRDSPTFGRGLGLTLDWTEAEGIYVPPGCAHGFLVLSERAIVQYNCTSYHEPDSDAGVRWDSPETRDFFPPDLDPVLSPRDEGLPMISAYLKG